MRWRCSAYALHMSWSCSAYALELQRICVAYELELQLICVEVCQKRDFSRDIGSPTRGSASYYCISKCCRSSGSLSILTATIISFFDFSGFISCTVLKIRFENRSKGVPEHVRFFSQKKYHIRIRSICTQFNF